MISRLREIFGRYPSAIVTRGDDGYRAVDLAKTRDRRRSTHPTESASAASGWPRQFARLRQTRASPATRTAASILRVVDVDGAEIDLQRGVLEFADRPQHAGDDDLDLVGRADPGAAQFDLAVEP